MLVCGKCQFCFHFQKEMCHSVYFNVMHVSAKTVRGILKSKFIARQQQSGKGLCLWSHMCSSAGFTSSLAAAVFPLPRSAFQINEMLKCFPLYESKSLPTFRAGQKKNYNTIIRTNSFWSLIEICSVVQLPASSPNCSSSQLVAFPHPLMTALHY